MAHGFQCRQTRICQQGIVEAEPPQFAQRFQSSDAGITNWHPPQIESLKPDQPPNRLKSVVIETGALAHIEVPQVVKARERFKASPCYGRPCQPEPTKFGEAGHGGERLIPNQGLGQRQLGQLLEWRQRLQSLFTDPEKIKHDGPQRRQPGKFFHAAIINRRRARLTGEPNGSQVCHPRQVSEPSVADRAAPQVEVSQPAEVANNSQVFIGGVGTSQHQASQLRQAAQRLKNRLRWCGTLQADVRDKAVAIPREHAAGLIESLYQCRWISGRYRTCEGREAGCKREKQSSTVETAAFFQRWHNKTQEGKSVRVARWFHVLIVAGLHIDLPFFFIPLRPEASMPSVNSQTSRRRFLQTTTAGAAGFSAGVFSSLSPRPSLAATDKLQLACIGTANRARANIGGVRGEEIIAICDIDETYLDKAAKQFPEARRYTDYRELIDQEQGRVDAVVVSTADHHHVPASLRAIRNKMHVYCEKPLAHTVAEARLVTDEARAAGVATQLGTQIHAGDNYRRVVELVRSGAIGDVTEVHVWVGKGWGGGDRPIEAEEPPKTLHWDLWIGPAPERPYAAGRYHPAQWRRWWDPLAKHR